MKDEIGCYDEIIDCYNKNKGDQYKKMLCINHSIINVLRDSNITDKNLIRNALILTLSLFEDKPADIYDNSGFDLNTLKDMDKKNQILSELRKEFLPN